MSIASRINEMTEHLRNDWNSIDKLGLKAKKLPDEYKQVEYIESSGTQYIDTGFVPNQNTRTIIDFMPTFSSGSLFIFGSRLGFANNAYNLYAFGDKFRDDYANTTYGDASSQPFPKSANKRYLFDKNKNHSIMYEENVQFYDHTFTEKKINSSFNMFLFGLNDNGSIMPPNIAKMKLYSCKIYDNDILVRDFIPCYRVNDEEVGLYDTINDVFYTNQGTGVFTYDKTQEEIPNKNIKNIAPVLDRFYNQSSDKTDLAKNGVVGRTSQNTTIPVGYTRVDYIESSGAQYIDTSVNADSNLRVVLDIQYTDLSNDSNTNYGVIRSGSPNIRYHLMSQGVKFKFYTMDTGINLSNSDTNRHTFDLDVPNNIITVDSTQIEKISTAFNTQLNFWLFGRNSDNQSYKFYNSSKLYSCQMYYDNEIVRDFIPCYRNSDNVVGLYDIINNVFYTNQGTGVFTYGNIIVEPSPDYPQEINNLSGDVEYKVRGKNLFDINSCPILEYAFYDGNGNPVSWSGTCGIREYIKLDENSTYAIKYNGSNNFLICFYDENKTYLSQLVKASGGNFTMPSTAKYIRFGIVTAIANVEWCQIEKGTTATPYEPYISESFPLSLGDIELCNISDYKDRIYSQNGEFYLEKKNGKVVLDGSEDWYAQENIPSTNSSTIRKLLDFGNNNYYSNYFIKNNTSTYNRIALYEGKIYLRIEYQHTGVTSSDNASEYLTKMKTWLSTHNTEVQYVLTTPTTTEITQENYPTLYSQLLAIQEFLTKYKINKEFLLDYSSPEIEY